MPCASSVNNKGQVALNAAFDGGPPTMVVHEENARLTDLSLREWAMLVPLLVFIVWIGVYPSLFTDKARASIDALLAQVQSKASVAMR